MNALLKSARPGLALVFLAGTLLAGCGDRVPEDSIVARIDGDPVTLDAFEHWLERQGRTVSPETAGERLREFLTFRLRVREARRRGLHADPEMQYRFDRMLARVIEEKDAAERKQAPAPSEKDLRDLYETRIEDFRIPARVRAAMIFVEAPAGGDAARRDARRRELEAVRETVSAWAPGENPAHFGELAVQHSYHQPTRYQGGDLGWWREGEEMSEWHPEIRNAVFALKEPGEVSPVVESESGFYLFRLIDRNEARYRPFEDVRHGLLRREIVRAEQRGREMREEELHARFDLEFYPERVSVGRVSASPR